MGVCRLLHGPLALQTSRRLCGRKLLGLSAGGRGVRPALEGIRDAQNLPGFFIDRRQVRQLVLQVSGKLVHVDHGLVGRGIQEPAFSVYRVRPQRRFGRQRDPGPSLHQTVNDLLFHAVGGVLLVLDHVHVTVSQQLAIDAHALLQYHREHVRPVEGNFGRPHDRPAILVNLRLRSRNHQTGAVGDGQGHLFVFLLFGGPVRAPAPRAGSLAVVPKPLIFRLRGRSFRCQGLQPSAETGRHILCQLHGQGPARDLLPGLRCHDVLLRFHGVLLRCLHHGLPVLDDLPGEGAHPAAMGTDRHPPRLVVL